MRVTNVLLVAAGLLALAACDRPKVRKPPPPPEHAASAARPPMPPLPEWSKELIGKPLASLFAGEFPACVGNTDNVEARYGGDAPGVEIVGWAWDPAIKAPIARVLLVDVTGLIAGAGETGLPRRDVNAAKPEITSPTTGWAAYTSRTAGPVDAYGVVGDGKSLCRMGRLEF